MSRIFEALQRSQSERAGSPEPNDLSDNLSQLAVTLGRELRHVEDAPQFSLTVGREQRLIVRTEPNCLAAEQFRVLASRLKQAQQRRSLKKILVTSAIRGDGKSTISTNLALTLAAHGERTLLIDGDLHQATLAKILGVNAQEGLSTIGTSSGSMARLLYRAEDTPLWFLPAGRCSSQPLGIIQSVEMSNLLAEMSSYFSWIVIDSPPLVPLADSSVWVSLSDCVVFAMRSKFTEKK